ncbi:metal ABC transporter permease [Jatrophihabitans sp.]|uniref:metal ABC transporter permease n=1 Tax=Jatrophihabitans sp. TaxID=1932789 RepID=UPI002D17A054|nr:metal ABC transporter permease [Jatrophihabitans sp.]
MTGFSLDLVADVQQLLSYHFMLNALRAGTIVAVLCGAIGYFMVLRRQSFAGHTLAVIGFPGAAGATWLGVGTGLGYYGFCVAGALVIAALPGPGRLTGGLGGDGESSAVVGTVQAFALACGFLFVTLYQGFLSGLTGLLFGSITGVSDGQVLALLAAGAGCLLALAVLGRPLLFSSIDAEVARARGVPVRLVGTAFLVLLGLAAAGASQITGSLLVFALLVTPAAAASQLTARPGPGLLLSVLIAVAVTWLGEGIAFFSPYPIGFWVTTLAFAAFCLALGYRHGRDRWARPRAGHPQPAGSNR